AQHLIQQGLPSVIAMQFAISDQAAIALTHEFYRALADGYPVDAALAEARKAIFAQQTGSIMRRAAEWAVPTLFMRAPDGKLFEIEGVAEEGPAPGAPPFKGLRYFDEQDSPRFFGRERLTAELVAHLRSHRVLAVVGASGSGKSSLVRAGLIPALKGGQALPPLPLPDGHDELTDGTRPASGETRPPSGSTTWPIHIITPTNQPLKALAASLTRE
ncbi:MAG: CHAT domain-containing protein, partial [Ardenticatenaceae bacterium]